VKLIDFDYLFVDKNDYLAGLDLENLSPKLNVAVWPHFLTIFFAVGWEMSIGGTRPDITNQWIS